MFPNIFRTFPKICRRRPKEIRRCFDHTPIKLNLGVVKGTKDHFFKNDIFTCEDIENTSWKVLAYGIYTRVVDVSEIERVRFLIQKQRERK